MELPVDGAVRTWDWGLQPLAKASHPGTSGRSAFVRLQTRLLAATRAVSAGYCLRLPRPREFQTRRASCSGPREPVVQRRMQAATVAVVTATRNRPALLDRALASIARQTFADFQVFVVDDGSSEEHAAAYRATIGRYGSRFHLLQPLRPDEAGSGPSMSRNRGMFAGDDPYIAFLDDDDVWTWERHLETAVEALQRTGLEFYCGNMQGYRGDELVLASWFPDGQRLAAGQQVEKQPPVYSCTRRAFLDAAQGHIVHPNMLVLHRRLVTRTGGFLPNLWFAEDAEFVLRLLDDVENILFCPQVVARYRLPESDSFSSRTSRTVQDLNALAGAQHLRMVARTIDVRNAARDIESWTLRSLSEAMKRTGRSGDAFSLALQALVVRPSLGGILQLARSLSSSD